MGALKLPGDLPVTDERRQLSFKSIHIHGRKELDRLKLTSGLHLRKPHFPKPASTDGADEAIPIQNLTGAQHGPGISSIPRLVKPPKVEIKASIRSQSFSLPVMASHADPFTTATGLIWECQDSGRGEIGLFTGSRSIDHPQVGSNRSTVPVVVAFSLRSDTRAVSCAGLEYRPSGVHSAAPNRPCW